MAVNILIKDTILSSNETTFSPVKETLLKNKKNTPLTFLLAGSNLISQTRYARFAEEKPFTCDQSLLEKMIENAAQAFSKEVESKNARLISQHTLSISLNGYEVSTLKNQKAKEMKVHIAFWALSEDIKKKLLSVLGITEIQHVQFDSLTFAQAQSIGEKYKENEFMLVSVYEHSTDLSIRRGKGFFETTSVPIGTTHIAEHPNLSEFQTLLDEHIKKAFKELSKGILIPSKVYLEVDPKYKDIFEYAFRKDTYHTVSFSEKGFEVVPIEGIISL